MALLFLRKQEILSIHAQAIKVFGGSPGLRNEGALESALAAVENSAYYENSDLITCAAIYAYHLTQAHAFVDGNKRVAAAAAEIFLEINGAYLNATNDEIVALFLGVASGRLSRDEVVELFKQWVVF